MCQTAVLLTLVNRRHCRSGADLVSDSLSWEPPPESYPELAGMVMASDLSDPGRVGRTCERLWAGLQVWPASRDRARRPDLPDRFEFVRRGFIVLDRGRSRGS